MVAERFSVTLFFFVRLVKVLKTVETGVPLRRSGISHLMLRTETVVSS